MTSGAPRCAGHRGNGMKTIQRTYKNDAEATEAMRRASEFGWTIDGKHIETGGVVVSFSREEKSKPAKPALGRWPLHAAHAAAVLISLGIVAAIAYAVSSGGRAAPAEVQVPQVIPAIALPPAVPTTSTPKPLPTPSLCGVQYAEAVSLVTDVKDFFAVLQRQVGLEQVVSFCAESSTLRGFGSRATALHQSLDSPGCSQDLQEAFVSYAAGLAYAAYAAEQCDPETMASDLEHAGNLIEEATEMFEKAQP